MKLRILTFWYITPCHYFPHFLLSNNLYDWSLCITLMSKKDEWICHDPPRGARRARC